MPSTLGRFCVLALSTSALLVACKPKEPATDTATAAGAVSTPADSTHAAMANDSANAGNKSWTDAQILGFAWAANTGEIKEGTLAETKATNAKVKAFARQMVADHKAMLAEGTTFGKTNNITPDTTRGDTRDLVKDGGDELNDLNTKAAGNDWDKNFIDKEIDGHKKVLDKLNAAAQATANPKLKETLTKATGKVQEHLTKAQDIKANVLKS